jgi:glutaredoxin
VQVTVYVKAGCSLCDEALELLHAASGAFLLEIRTCDIAGELGLFRRYRYRVPVVCLNGVEALELRFSAQALAAKLEAAALLAAQPPPRPNDP